MDSDQILVLHHGEVAECAPPLELLDREGSALRATPWGARRQPRVWTVP